MVPEGLHAGAIAGIPRGGAAPTGQRRALAGVCGLLVALCALGGAAQGRTFEAGPGNYREFVSRLATGDTLRLEPGTYTQGLRLHDVAGIDGQPIVIEGPAEGEAAVFAAQQGRNTVSLANVNHLMIRHLTLDGRRQPVDAVKLEGTARYGHNVTLEGLTIRGHDAHQQNVGISTKAPAYGWVIRGNRIEGAGTGVYLGDSDGSAPFVGGIIEGNLITDTIGYNLQIKHQTERPEGLGLPDSPQATILRDNVFSKASGGATGDLSRPNVLLGNWPEAGPGAYDRYLVYRNLFHENPTEALLQATGRLAVYNNALVTTSAEGVAMRFVPHTDRVRYLEVFHNTVLAKDVGVAVWQDEPSDRRWVGANLIFAQRPLEGSFEGSWNVTEGFEAAREWLQAPFAAPGDLDLHPRADAPEWPSIPDGALVPYPDAERDFDGVAREAGVPGAFVGVGETERGPLSLQPPVITPRD